MPILRRKHQCGESLCRLLLQIRLILEQCAGAQIVTILGSNHQRREGILIHLLGICLCLEQCPGDLLVMV